MQAQLLSCSTCLPGPPGGVPRSKHEACRPVIAAMSSFRMGGTFSTQGGLGGGWNAVGKLDLARRSVKARLPRGVITAAVAPVVVALPPYFGYVMLTAAAGAIVVQWQAIMVSKQRQKAGVKYPQMYEGTPGSLFDCYQRAHMNTLELFPTFLGMLILAGLAFPKTATICGWVFVVARIFYSLGYYTGDPNKRHQGSWGYFGLFGLIIATIVGGFRQVASLSSSGALPKLV